MVWKIAAGGQDNRSVIVPSGQSGGIYGNAGGNLISVLVMQPDNTFIVHSAKAGRLQGIFGPYASKPEVTRAIAQAIGGNCRFGI